jgi:glycopeptide antibiotics resistance protein
MIVAFYKSRKRSLFYRFILVCFCSYLLLLTETVFFPILVPVNWPHNLSIAEMKSALEQINLIPFHQTGILDSAPLSASGIQDIFINLLMTVPIGLALTYLVSLRGWSVILLVVATGLLFEGVQLTVKLATGTFYHTVDINDVIMNALGVLVGYIIFKIIQWINLKLRA